MYLHYLLYSIARPIGFSGALQWQRNSRLVIGVRCGRKNTFKRGYWVHFRFHCIFCDSECYVCHIWYMQTLSGELYVPLTLSRMYVLVCVDTAPLGGKGIHFSTDKTVAYLNFENDCTAQRAELICRAVAAAGEKNMQGNTVSGSDTSLLSNPPEVSLMYIHNSICTHKSIYPSPFFVHF